MATILSNDKRERLWDEAEREIVALIRQLIAEHRGRTDFHGEIGAVILVAGQRGPHQIAQTKRVNSQIQIT